MEKIPHIIKSYRFNKNQTATKSSEMREIFFSRGSPNRLLWSKLLFRKLYFYMLYHVEKSVENDIDSLSGKKYKKAK